MTTNQSSKEALLQLQKRARRRLVGAVMLVLFAVVVLWNLLDATPPAKLVNSLHVAVTQIAPGAPLASAPRALSTHEASHPVSAQALTASVPTNAQAASAHLGKDALPGTFVPGASMTQAREIKPVEAKPAPTTAVEKQPVDMQTTPARRDPQRILEGLGDGLMPTASAAKKTTADVGTTKYGIQVAAYSDASKAQSVLSTLKAAGVRVRSERVMTSKGEFTRVWVGPYASRADAETALKKMQIQGVNGMLVKK